METAQEIISPFERVKARHLVGWLLVAFPLLLLAVGLTKDSALDSVWVYAWVYIVPIVWYLLRARKRGLLISGLIGTKPERSGWLWYVLLNIPVLLFSVGSVIVIYGLVSRYAPGFVEGLLAQPESEVKAVAQHPLFATLLELFGALVLAPVVEEFIFRGFLLHRWTQKWGVRRAIVAVSILFGILHINFFGAAVFSVVLCVIYIHTRSIWPSIVLHFVNNLLSSWPRAESDAALSSSDLQSSILVGGVFVVIAFPILIRFIYKHWPAQGVALPYSAPQV